jgi:hypothetical protein
MTKKKSNNIEKQFNIETALKDSIHIGTPPAVLLPARNFRFKIVNDNVTININREGSYFDLAPEVFNEGDGSFNILDESNSIIYIPSITKVLFAQHRYPAMESNQLFVLIALKFKKESVDVMGQIIEIMPQ